MLTGPAPATRKALKKAGLTIDDIDLIEMNEAFAAVVLRFVKDMDVDIDKVNVNGGAIAMGHPLGATGGMILGTLIDELERTEQALRPGHAVHRRRHGHRDDRGAHLMSDSTIRYEKDADGVVILTLDDPNQSANTMNEAYKASMAATVDRLEAEKDEITGVVITSAKKTFFAGGDLNDLKQARKEDAAEVAEMVRELKSDLRRLETLGKPVVAAINGAALGGGLEIALAAHSPRRASTTPRSCSASPRSSSACCPGGGGVTRSVRMFGIADALLQLLLQGQRHCARPRRWRWAWSTRSSPPREELVPAAKKWIAANPEAVQPWDVKGYKIPGGTPSNPKFAANLPAFPANLRKKIKGANYPAPHHIMAAAVEGAQVDFDTAIEIEGRYFVDLVTGQVAKNMIQAFFFDLQAVNGDRGRPEGIEPTPVKKVVVLGAGMMGAAIAYVSRQGRHRGRAQGRRPGRRRQGQGLLGQARREGRLARQDDAGEGRRAARR